MQCGFAQNIDLHHNGHPMTAAEKLKQHHIDLTKEALIDALQNSDAEVRYLAAQQLATDREPDAISAIVDAATREKIPRTRINMAFSLASAGEKRGLAIL